MNLGGAKHNSRSLCSSYIVGVWWVQLFEGIDCYALKCIYTNNMFARITYLAS